jgi:hypothetical protein
MAQIHNLETARTIKDVQRGWKTIDGIPFQCDAWVQQGFTWVLQYHAEVTEDHFRKGLAQAKQAQIPGFFNGFWKWLVWFAAGCVVVRVMFSVLGL